jgi:bifunctional non-homologous end joining protein LigD
MAKALEEYTRKRDFAATPEPSGAGRKRKATEHALQYCIQKHDASHLHYDFRLELDGTLKSWAIPKGPSLDPKVRRLAVQVEDHPLDYAAFEGHIPEGHYGAGDVIVWDRGVWVPQGDPQTALAKGKLKFELRGEKLAGVWNLVRTHLSGSKTQWFLIKSNDEQARPQADYDIVAAQPDSVLSERTLVPRQRGKAKSARPVKTPARARPAKSARTSLEGARQLAMPDSLAPQLATLVESVPEGDWLYEVKFDGYRIMARIEGGEVRLITRNGHDWTHKMPAQAKALAALGLQSAWLDGEIVVADEDGLPDFQALQNAFETHKSGRIVFYLFDVPYLNGMDLREVPLEQRRAALAALLLNNRSELLRFSEAFGEDPEQMLGSACQMKLEGLIGKRAGSAYVSRRSNDWIKLKCKHRQEFVIVGYSEPKGARSAFGALLLGLHDADSGELRYAGKVGTGFNEITLRSLHGRLQPLEIAKPQVRKPPTGYEAKGVHWLRPELMCEVAYAEITKDGIIRHSVFHGLREDKPVQDITQEVVGSAAGTKRASAEETHTTKKPAAAASAKKTGTEQPRIGQIRITHPDRIIDPTSGATKRELAEYYALIAPWALPWLKDRPVALVRAPEGIAGELFFQKHSARLSIPHITHLDRKYDPEHGELMAVNSVEALVGAAQMGTIELHTWNGTVPNLEKPDRFVLDLDPDPALPWKSMIEATQLVQTLLDELGLVSFLKTSGGKGIHVVVPLTRRQGWDEIKAFSQAIAQYMAALMPDRFSAVLGPKNRVGKIFIDYLRNGRGASCISPYSARTREGLPVSVPIHRQELGEIKGANGWTIRNVLRRLEEMGEDDPWADLPGTRQSITADMRKRLQRKRT